MIVSLLAVPSMQETSQYSLVLFILTAIISSVIGVGVGLGLGLAASCMRRRHSSTPPVQDIVASSNSRAVEVITNTAYGRVIRDNDDEDVYDNVQIYD